MKISTREYRTAVKGQSWKFKLMNDIDKAMNISGSKEDFINAMSIMGYSVTWTDGRKYITYQCPNKMKCRDIKLHNDKYLKGSMENEFRYRQEQYFGQPQAEEQQLTDSDRATIRRNKSDFDSVTGQRGGTQSVENGNNLSAGAEENFGTDSERNQVGANADDRINPTGWEESRGVFEQYLATRSGTGISNCVTSEEVNSNDNLKMDSNNGAVLGGINSLAESLSRIADDESEDEEERRKRIVAEQNGSDIGTAIGIAVGVLAGAISKEENIEYEYEETGFNMSL